MGFPPLEARSYAAAGGPVWAPDGPEDGAMTKQKTHKASKKRFRATASGLLNRSQAGKKHLNSHKTGKRKRQLRRKLADGSGVAVRYVEHAG